ncbi:Fe-S cluster assembly protein SufD [Bowdeniella nasicola]|uniref:Fe-S cluster assembly protein SufD n=1 Tax=Bowdeniella nasicola TaxID=208480 RepID=UPI000ABE2C76|nr:Fe-S cluster assembly protein SufD [Bowdeniella nasicola]
MTTLSTDHSRAELAGDHTHGSTPAADKADKPRSFELADFPVPAGREEDWRFTPIKRMSDLFADTLTGPAPSIRFEGSDLTAEGLPFDVTTDECPCVGSVGAPADRTSVVAWANRGTPTCITVGESASRPLVFDIVGDSREAAAQHVTINIADGVEATIVLRHTGSVQLTQTVEIDAGADSDVTIVSTQEWDDDAVHAASHRISAGKDAVVKHIVVTLGADLVRITTDVEFAGEGADVELLGVYFTDAGQHHEHRLFVEHRLPNCVSDATYKGALQGKDAHAVWVGDVLIGHDATGTDTYELNRNLLLTEGARADSVPNLEIETGEIAGAGHASATGRFDDEQLFYLMSRGVPEDLARRLVVRGFFAELINRIGVPEVQDRLIAAIEAELDQTMALIK